MPSIEFVVSFEIPNNRRNSTNPRPPREPSGRSGNWKRETRETLTKRTTGRQVFMRMDVECSSDGRRLDRNPRGSVQHQEGEGEVEEREKRGLQQRNDE